MGRLEGRAIIVTGGAAGIGRAFAEAYVREGASVLIADINGPEAERTAAALGELGGDALAVPTDVSSVTGTEAMAAAAMERWGRIDGLVNNAAIAIRVKHTVQPMEEIDPAEWDRIINVNLRGVFLCSRAVVPHMKAARYGKIINIASGTAFNGRPFLSHYVASKGGVLTFTRSLAREVGDWNITVNSIAPGLTASETEETPMSRYEARVPDRAIKRVETPADLVGAGIFFISSESDFITGQSLIVDGGVAMN
jgi:3-oxoacyl-[acyl-carrier protein] reductase